MKIDYELLLRLIVEGKPAKKISEITGLSTKQIYNAKSRLVKQGFDLPVLPKPSKALEIANRLLKAEKSPLRTEAEILKVHRRGNLEPISFRLRKDLVYKIRGYAVRCGLSQSELVEIALDKYFEKFEG